MKKLPELAKEYYLQGYSCSEAVVKAAYDAQLLPENINEEQLNQIASAFSGGMNSGCVCGAVAGAQIITGLAFGRKNTETSPMFVKGKAKEVVDNFKKIRKVTCCKALTAAPEVTADNRREHCANIVFDAAKVLEEVYKKSALGVKA